MRLRQQTIGTKSKAPVIFAHFASVSLTDLSALERSISALESSISALDNDVKALDISSVPWEVALSVATFLVVVGLAMEYWVIFFERKEEWHDFRLGIVQFTAKPRTKKFVVELVSVSLITLGVFCEFAFGLRIASISNSLRGKSAELRSKNAELRTDSDQLVALVTKEAADANERAAEIQEALAPRRLTTEQQLSVALLLKRFNRQKAQMVYDMGDNEGLAFAVDVWTALKRANWNVYFPASLLSGTKFGDEGPPNGFSINKALNEGIEIFPTQSSEVPSKALAASLNKLGFNAEVVRLLTPRKDVDGIQVTVLTRPLGPQGAAKLRAETKKKQANSAQANN